jgi:hypothetical protein
LTADAVGRARKKRWLTDPSASISANIAAEPTHKAKDLVGSCEEKPLGVAVVVPMTVCRESADWCGEDLYGDRAPGLKIGEFEGVILSDAPGPTNLLFALHELLAITSSTRADVQILGISGSGTDSGGTLEDDCHLLLARIFNRRESTNW